jgi:hypothetical protein
MSWLRAEHPAASSAVRFIVILALVALASPYAEVRSAYADVAVAASSGDFLTFEVGGRSAGMAGAHTAVVTGVTAQFWNPAGLSNLSQPQVGAMHAKWLGDLSYEWLGIAKPMGKLGVGSLSMAYFHTPGIQGYDQFDNPTGEFKVYDMAITAGLSRALTREISFGANAKMIRQNLGDVAANAPAVDVGLRGDFAGIMIGAAVQNLGPQLSFDGAGYPLPRQIKLGVGRSFYNDKVQLAADYNMPSDYYNDVRIGTEVRAHPNVSLRLGYRHEFTNVGSDPANGLSYGLGIHFHQLDLDYALTPSNDFDNVHRLSFGYSFGAGPEEKPDTPKEKAPPPPPPPVTKTTPPVIASNNAPAPAAPKPQARTSTTSTQAAPKAAPTPAPAVAAAPQVAEAKPVKPAASLYDVVLPGYWSREAAQAELKALEMLGFKTKDAVIEKSTGSTYQVRLARVKSRSNADDMASSLVRMSFRAVVQVAQQ